jgi:hypothetical protein
MSASIKSNSSGNLELYSGATKVLEANAGTGVVSGLKVAAGSSAGQAVNYDQVIGVGQTWQNVMASRALGVTYTNTTGKPIIFAVTSVNNASGHTQSTFVNGVDLGSHSTATGANLSFAVVPAGATYMTIVDGGATLMKWTELR